VRRNTIYRSLNEERLYGGVQRMIVLGNLAITLITCVGLGWYWTVLPALAFHFVMRNINKNDPKIMQVYSRYAKQGMRYDPWPRRNQLKQTLRPAGFARGVMC
jgi:type IV secretory pathway TrbD component